MPEMVEDRAGFRLKGWHVLAILVGTFAVVAAVNVYFVYVATSTMRGLDDRNPYEHGVAFEKDVVSAEQQQNLHWKVDIALRPGTGADRSVTIAAVDKDNHALTGMSAHLELTHPTDARKDKPVTLSETQPGTYTGAFTADAGKWYLQLVLNDSTGKMKFRSRNVINLQ